MSNPCILELELELLSDVCVSTSNRTLGPAGTFECIPGRTLWGAAASAAYRSGMAEDEAFRLFHQGAVRLLDAVPMHGNARTYPVPRSLHRRKDVSAAEAWNFTLREVREQWKDVQCKPVGEGWLTPDGTQVRVETLYTLRTSIDASGRAREGLLFGLPALRAGTRLWTALLGEKADVERVAALITLPGGIRLGRSRNVELGLVKVNRRTEPAARLASAEGATQRLSFLCASRCLFRDRATGAPTLVPSPEDFGLDSSAWVFDDASSFVRTARISHFNSKRRRPETERLAVERGSVLTFASRGPSVDPKTLGPLWALGVGEHRGEGYGEVVAMPTWLHDRSVVLREAGSCSVAVNPPPTDELFTWASETGGARDQAAEAYGAADECARNFLRRHRVPPSQWGELRAKARSARFLGQPGAALRNEIEHWLKSGWRNLSPRWKAARGPLLEACTHHLDDLPLFLEHLASACMRPGLEEER